MSEETRIQVFKNSIDAIERFPRGELPNFPELMEVHKSLDLAACWGTLRKHRRLILTIFLVVFGAVAIWTFLQTPIYRARTLLEIEKENPNIVTAQDLFGVDSVTDVYLETQYRVLESDSLAEQVIDQLGLAKMPEFAGGRRWFWQKKPSSAPQGSASNPSLKTLDGFRTRLEITPIRRSRLVEITFDSKDPDLATRVVNSFASLYIARNLQTRKNEAQKVEQVLSAELADATTKRQNSQDKLKKYALDNDLMFLNVPGGGNENLVSGRLQKLQDDLTAAQAARSEKESLYHLVRNGDTDSLPGVVDNKLIQDLTVQLADLQKQYAQMKTVYSPSYYKVQEVQNQIREIEGSLARERNRVAQRITQDYKAALDHEALARQNFDAQRKDANLVAGRLTEYNMLNAEVDANKKRRDDLAQRVQEASFSTDLNSSKIRIVDSAQPPTKPVSPRVAINLGLGALVGLVLGIGITFLRDSMDKTVRSPEEVESLLSLPMLAAVPTINFLSDHSYTYKPLALPPPRGTAPLVTVLPDLSAEVGSRAARATLAEAFRSLCSSMLLSANGRMPASIQVSSTWPGEGKTMTATNLSIALAELGKGVLLIDADMRRPKVQSAFRITVRAGLSAYLAGELPWREAVRRTPIQGLDVLLCGSPHPNPIPLLSSDRMSKLLEEAGKEYTFVVVDSPPLLNVADGRILARMVDGVILVVKSGATPQILVQRAESYIRGAGAKITGVVLNNFNDELYSRFSNPLYYSARP